jgi:hypothetical protein
LEDLVGLCTVSPIRNSAKAFAAFGCGEPLMTVVGAGMAKAPSAGKTICTLCPALRAVHA